MGNHKKSIIMTHSDRDYKTQHTVFKLGSKLITMFDCTPRESRAVVDYSIQKLAQYGIINDLPNMLSHIREEINAFFYLNKVDTLLIIIEEKFEQDIVNLILKDIIYNDLIHMNIGFYPDGQDPKDSYQVLFWDGESIKPIEKIHMPNLFFISPN